MDVLSWLLGGALLACTEPADPDSGGLDSGLPVDSHLRPGDSAIEDTGIDLPECGSAWVDVDVGTPDCGVREGGCVECWSRDSDVREFVDNVPPARFREVSAKDYWDTSWGGGLICGIGRSGTTHCWGGDVPIPGALATLSIGDATTCAIRVDRSLVCVDRYVDGVDLPGPFWAVDTAPNETGWCAAPADGGILCDDGYVDGVEGRFIQLSNDGHGNGCGLRADGTAACWSLGSVSRDLESKGTIAAVANLTHSAVVLTTDGRLEATALTGDVPGLPTAVFSAIDDNGHAMCAVRADGSDIECFDYLGRSLPGPDDDTPTW